MDKISSRTSEISTETDPEQANKIFSAFICDLTQDTPHLLSDGIYCKRCALGLQEYFTARTPHLQSELGKVEKKHLEAQDLLHSGGGVYHHHYVLIVKISGEEYVFDPYLYPQDPKAIKKETYIDQAYQNPNDVVWGVPQYPTERFTKRRK